MNPLHTALLVLCSLLALGAGGVLVATAGASSGPDPDDPSAEPAPQTEPEPAAPRVVNRWIKRPRERVVRKRNFKPWAKPSPRQVRRIIRIEQRRWGGPPITHRVSCESSFRWNATNGQYRGLLQIGPWWNYAWPKTPRRVVLTKTKTRRKKVWRITRYSDGSRKRVLLRKAKQKLIVKRVGKLPASASPYHGWAAIRVGQRAVAGAGPTTMWECGV